MTMLKLPTPSTAHLAPKLNTTIYEPAEDSYLLLDTLSSASETTFLRHRFPRHAPAPLALEVGTGSGVVIAFLTAHAHAILHRPILSLGIDVNLEACVGTQQTVDVAVSASVSASQNGQSLSRTGTTPPGTGTTGTYLSSLCSDLTAALLPHSIDILMFNPPYVPSESLPALPSAPIPSPSLSLPPATATPSLTKAQLAQSRFERESHLLSLTYAGGAAGMETTERLLAQLPEVLSARGVAYVLLCAQNRPAEVVERLRRGEYWAGGGGGGGGGDEEGERERQWRAEVVGETGGKGGWERLVVVRIWRGDGEQRDRDVRDEGA